MVALTFWIACCGIVAGLCKHVNSWAKEIKRGHVFSHYPCGSLNVLECLCFSPPVDCIMSHLYKDCILSENPFSWPKNSTNKQPCTTLQNINPVQNIPKISHHLLSNLLNTSIINQTKTPSNQPAFGKKKKKRPGGQKKTGFRSRPPGFCVDLWGEPLCPCRGAFRALGGALQ